MLAAWLQGPLSVRAPTQSSYIMQKPHTAFGALLIQTKKIMCAVHTGTVIREHGQRRGRGGGQSGGADPSK